MGESGRERPGRDPEPRAGGGAAGRAAGLVWCSLIGRARAREVRHRKEAEAATRATLETNI